MIQTAKGLRVLYILLSLFLAAFFVGYLLRIQPPPQEKESTTQALTVDSDECFPEEEKEDLYKIKEIMLVQFQNISTALAPPVPDFYTINVTIPNLVVSTCSDDATKRGPHQRIIAYSFYGKINCSRNYFEGIENNLILAEELYPDWTIRVYYELGEDAAQVLTELKDRYSNLDLCDTTNIPGYGNLLGVQRRILRFLPVVDPLVDVFISRDLDCRLSERELSAVNEWLESGLTFHIMRDSIFQFFPIMAGMWGVRVHQARELLFTLTLQMFMKGRVGQKKFFDQSVLGSVVWPVIKGHVMQHDSYYCLEHFWEHGHMRPFPTRRKENVTNNYIGSNVMEDFIMDYPCPEACRPQDHQDWTYC